MARLTHADRIKMEALLNAGHSVQEVADQLHVHRATVYREYKRGKYMHRNTEYIEEERYVCWIPQNVLTFINESYKIILLPVYI